MGDYFKEGAIEFAWELSLEGFGFNPDDIWVTVFEGDEELGLGPDEEAIDAWLAIGVPRERIVECPRSENFWQAGPTGPCGPCSELYLDRGLDVRQGGRPSGRRERALPGVLEPRLHAVRAEPGQHADAAAGAEHRHRPRPQPPRARSCRASQSVFDTDQFIPLIELGEELSRQGARARRDDVDRALRVLADHTRGMSLPDRRRRRPVQRGPRLRAAPPDAPRDRPGPPDRHRARVPARATREVVRETMGAHYAELLEQADTVDMWLRTEEEAFNRTLESGPEDARRRDRAGRRERRGGHRRRRGLQAARHVRVPVRPDARARRRARPGRGRAGLRVPDGGAAGPGARVAPAARAGRTRARSCARSPSGAGAPSVFTGYETTEQATAVAGVVASRTAACWPSSSSRRSTPPAAARSTTAA